MATGVTQGDSVRREGEKLEGTTCINRTPSVKRLHEAATLHLEAWHLVPRRRSGKGTHEQITCGK